MLPNGKLRGWNPYYGFGYPVGELTPFGPEAWVAIFRLLTFGSLTWIRTYGIAFTGALLFAAFGLFSFARRQFGVGAAVVAACLNVLDKGAWAEGGWFWHTKLGVWPVTLAMGFALFALAKLMDVMSTRRHRDVVIAAVLIAASLTTHPLSLTVYPVAVPLLVLDRRLRDGGLAGGSIARLLLACATGLGLAAFYVIPMLARSDLTQDLGVLGDSLAMLGRKAGDAALFGGMWSPLFALGLVGAILAVGDRRRFRPLVPIGAGIFVLLSSDLLVEVLHLERLVPSLIKIEAHRFVLIARLFWFALVGHAVITIARWIRSSSAGHRNLRTGTWAATALVLLISAPIAWPALKQVYQTQVKKPLLGPEVTPFWEDLSSLLEWTKEVRRSSSEFYRIAYALPMHDHISGIAPVFDQTFLYKVGYTPVQIFNRFPMSDEPAVLEALSVKFLVSNRRLNDANFEFERSFGEIHVHRFKRFRPQPFELIGKGQAMLRSFGPERIRIDLKGTDSRSRLKLDVASYPRWSAVLNGATVPITTVTVHDSQYPMLMEVPVRDGELEFRYVRRGVDWAGFGLSLLTLVGLVGVPILRRTAARRSSASNGRLPAWGAFWKRARGRIPRVLGRRGTTIVWAFLAVSTVVCGTVLWYAAKPPLPAHSLFESGAPVTLSLGGTACEATGAASFKCGDDRIEPGVRSGLYGAHFCMHAPGVGPLVVGVPVKSLSFVAGRYDVAAGGGYISVDLDGQSLGRMSTRGPSQGLQFFQFDARDRARRSGTLRITLQGAPLHCFDLSIRP